MIFGLEFTDEVDPTAPATLALAMVTVGSVVLAWRALRQTRDEISLSRREVEEAHRPVLTPAVDATKTLRAWGYGEYEFGPQVPAVARAWPVSSRPVVRST
jgi:hypothetical protein